MYIDCRIVTALCSWSGHTFPELMPYQRKILGAVSTGS